MAYNRTLVLMCQGENVTVCMQPSAISGQQSGRWIPLISHLRVRELHYVEAFWYNGERYGDARELNLAPACSAGRGIFAAYGRFQQQGGG